eukprot:Skav200664  [mRNA]  locus=scaffold1967:21615:24128:+ [translate_table: standard]
MVRQRGHSESGEWVTSAQAYGNFLPEVNRDLLPGARSAALAVAGAPSLRESGCTSSPRLCRGRDIHDYEHIGL